MSEGTSTINVVHLVDDDSEDQSPLSHIPSIDSISQIPESGDALLLDWVEEQHIHSNDCSTVASMDMVAKGERKRVRESTSLGGANRRVKRKVDPAAEAFRHSQRMMRKEAKQVCIKDVLSKTAVSPVSFSESNNEDSVLSIMSPNTSSVWSPQVANDITSHFLSSVEAKKKKRFEKFVAREVGNSQTSSPLLITPMNSGVEAFSLHPMGELVICDEDANMSPPSDELFLHPGPDDNGEWSTEKGGNDGAAIVRAGVILTRDDKKKRGKEVVESLVSPPPAPLSEEQEETLEKERAAVIARKHRIWELQQQSRRIEKETEKNDAVHSATSIGPSSSSTPLSPLNGANFQPPTSVPTYDIPEFFTPIPSLHRTRHAHDVSISESNLSTDDISMIQRINSFDKTSAQRVVVFSSVNPS